MKTIIIKVRNLPNDVDNILFKYCFQQDVLTSYPRAKVKLIEQDIKRFNDKYKSVVSELEADIGRAEYTDQSYVDVVSVSTLKAAVELLKLYKSQLNLI